MSWLGRQLKLAATWPLRKTYEAAWKNRTWKGKTVTGTFTAAAIVLPAVFPQTFIEKPISIAWNYQLGVSNDICLVTDKQPREYYVVPTFFGLLDRYVSEVDAKDRDTAKKVTPYFIYTKNVSEEDFPGHGHDNCDVMHISDTLLYGNTKSSSLYGQIERGGVYDLKNVGWSRNFITGYLGWTPNVVRVKEVKAPAQSPSP